MGPTNVADRTCCIGRGLAALRALDGLDGDFLLLCLRALESELASLGFGTTFVAINKMQLSTFELPVPPLPEQHRIVAKVEELMSLCDRLAALQKKRDAARNRVTVASLKRLGMHHADPSLFARDVRFALDHLNKLAARAEQVKELRKTILDLAVQGMLVPQDPNDQPASTLLEHLSVNRTHLVLPKPARKFNKERNDEFQRSCPRGWRRTFVDEVSTLITSGSRGWGNFYADAGPKFIRAQNIGFGKLRLEDVARVRPPKVIEGARARAERDDILIVITGAGVTNPALLDCDLGEAYVSQHVALVKLADRAIAQWIMLWLMAPTGARNSLVERAYGAGRPGLNLDNIRSLVLYLPPLGEQRRIVAKVHELMAICDRLEATLMSGEAHRHRLLNALLAEALAPAERMQTV